MSKPKQSADSPAREVTIGSYKITVKKAGQVDVVVTSGTLTGRSSRFFTMPPDAAYFNEPEPAKKRA